MKHLPQISSICSTRRRKLCLAIAAQMLLSAGVKAAPAGGAIVGGDGTIDQAGLNTTVIQNSDRLAIDWESFNIAADERVQFIQPDASSIALNRILGNEASQIFGRLDANGHVILMNPNGVLFGENASINVGGLVASGLAINSTDFMNGEFVLSAVEGADGVVVNKGIINAATGGSVALVGRQVDNQGLISANLGSVSLAAGKEAVLTFDNQGLLGVRVSREILQSELGVEAAVSNSGEITAEGGRILLTASVSQDIFSQAVNAEGLNAKTSVVMHEDGSFTLGAGAEVINAGTLSTSSETAEAGDIVVLGENVNSNGAILANSKTANAAGNIEIHSRDTTLLTESSSISAINDGAGSGGQIKILGNRVGILDQSQINTTGNNGGGDINIGGGFQGKETQLRNATRTVVGKNTLIEANAVNNGDAGDVIVWADETTSFAGEINVRGGALGGDGGFVEVSGKENLRFLGNVDRTAVRGENGTLLLDPENILIVPGSNGDTFTDTALLSDGSLLFGGSVAGNSRISADALRDSLLNGNTILDASGDVLFEAGSIVDVLSIDPVNIASLAINAGGNVQMQHNSYLNVGGDVVFNAGIADCGGASCDQYGAGAIFIAVGAFDGAPPFGFGDPEGGIFANGDIILRASDRIQVFGDLSGNSLSLRSLGSIELSTLTGNTTRLNSNNGNLELHAGDTSLLAGGVRELPLSSTSISLPELRPNENPDEKVLIFNGTTQSVFIRVLNGDLLASARANITGYSPEITVDNGNIVMESFEGDINIFSAKLGITRADAELRPTIRLSAAGNIESVLGNSSGADMILVADSDKDGIGNVIVSEDFSTGGGSFSVSSVNVEMQKITTISSMDSSSAGGDIFITVSGDVTLPGIVSGGGLYVDSIQGSVSLGDSVTVAGGTRVNAARDINLSGDMMFNPTGDVFFNAGRIIRVERSSQNVDLEEALPYIKLLPDNTSSFFWQAGSGIDIFELELGRGDFVAQANNGMDIDTLHTGGKVLLRSVGAINWRWNSLAEDGYDPMDSLAIYSDEQIYLPANFSTEGNISLHSYSGAANVLAGETFESSSGRLISLPELSATRELQNDGRVDWWSSGPYPMLTNGGDFYIQANTIDHFGGTVIDTSSIIGHGEITLIARDRLQAPPIRYSVAATAPQANAKITVQAGQVLFDQDFDFNNAGVVDLSIVSDGDVILGVVRGDQHDLSTGQIIFPTEPDGGRIFDSVGRDDERVNININAGGTIFQKYDVFSGGGDYIATASEFNFNDGVEINTDFSNATENSLSGAGNISLTETIDNPLFSNRFILPDIQTQADCAGENRCGDLVVVSSRSIYDSEPADEIQRRIAVFGNASIETDGDLDLFGDTDDIRFDGSLAVKARTVSLETRGGFELSDWIVFGAIQLAVVETEGRSSDLLSNSTLIGEAAIIKTPGELIFKGEQTYFSARSELQASRLELDHEGDLILGGLFLTGGPLSEASVINVNGNVQGGGENSWGIAGSFVDGAYQDASVVVFNVAGDLLLDAVDNKISSIQVLNANAVALQNSSKINLAGINAESLSLNILGDITQTSALNITGETSIIAAADSNIDLSNVLNDFNTISIQAAAPAMIEIADSGSISLADIDLNGAGSSSSLTVVAANILQADNGRILLQDGAELNLQGDYIILGAGGTASVDINGAVLNSRFSRDLSIGGTVRGASGTADSRFAGLYFDGVGIGNFFEVAAGGSIVGDFREGSKVFLGDGNDVANIAGNIAILVEGGAGDDTFTIGNSGVIIEQILGNDGSDILNGPAADAIWTITANGEGNVTSGNAETRFNGIERFFGGSGADSFVVESVTTPLELSGGLGVNSLSANSNDAAVDNQWIIDGINSGSLNELISFSAIRSLIGNGGEDRVTFLEGAQIGSVSTGLGDDTFILAAGINADLLDAGDGQDTLNLNGINFIYTYLNELISGDGNYIATGFEVESNEGGSKRVVGVDGYDAEWIIDDEGSVLVNAQQNGTTQTNRFVGVTRLEGASGNDTFILRGGYVEDRILGGQGGTDTLVADTSADNTWSISGSNSGSVAFGADGEQVFDAIANLVGGSDKDVFVLTTGGSISGIIDGGAGEDELRIEDITAENRWDLGPQNFLNSGNAFQAIEVLVGNSNNDIFNIIGDTDVLSLDGGLGGNVLNWYADDLVLNLEENTANQILALVNIRSFSAEGENNTLIGANSENFWFIGEQFSEGSDEGLNLTGTTIGEGMVNSVFFTGFKNLIGGAGLDTLQGMNANGDWQIGLPNNSNLNTLSYGDEQLVFSDMEKLVGGAGDDDFLVNATNASITLAGGAGTNTLLGNSASSINNLWTISETNTGSLNTSISYEQVQNLVGGAGNDTFIFSPGSSIGNINAGAGSDTFILANNVTAGILDGGEGVDTLDRNGLNSIMTYLREVIGGDAIYTAANIETETSIGGSTTVVGVDGYNAQWNITGNGMLSVTATDGDGVAITNQFSGVTRAEGGAGLDAFVLLSGGTLVDGIVGNGNDYLQGSESSNTWIVNAANGGELVQESGTRLQFQGISHLYGGNSSDIFDIASGGSVSGSIYGGGGADTLIISDASLSNEWVLGQENSVGSVAYFSEVETLIGNDNNDTFSFTGATDVIAIQGGAGDNNLVWRAGDLAVNLGSGSLNQQIQFSEIKAFDAEATASNTLIGADEDNAWTLANDASGTLTSSGGEVSFTGFRTLVGGTAADSFALAANAGGFIGVDGGAGEDRISAADILNEWRLDSAGGELNGMRFSNLETLLGGAQQDNFVLIAASSQAQAIDGDAGANRLTGFDQANAWNVTGDNAGDLTGLASFRNIQTLIGGSQADTFTLAAGVNLSEIYAGAGNDVFAIGAGVIADNFYGEAGDDSFDVGLGLQLSGALDGGTGGETEGDFIDLGKFTLLDATADLESVVGFSFRNFERIEQPNNQGIYFGGNGTNVWYITGANEGRLEIREGEKAGVYEFSGVHSLLGGEGTDIFIFANDAAAVSTLIDGGAGAGANTLDLSAQGLINRWLLDGANSGSVINSSNTNGNVFTNIAYLIGGSNRDLFELHAGGSIAGAIDGGLGADEFTVVVDQTSNWQLGGAGGHSVTGVASFTNIESLIGGAGVDNFDILASLTDVTQLTGGAGSDAVNFLYDSPVSVELARGLAGGLRVDGIERYTAIGADNSLAGVDAATTWTLDGADRGSIRYLATGGDAINVVFDGFGNLLGGAEDDQFLFVADGSVSGAVHGGGGRNLVDLQALIGDIEVAAGLTLAGIDHLVGNGRTTLYGASDQSYTWTIDGARSGRVTSTLVDDTNRLLAFENLSAIRGGAHDDIFQVIVATPLLSLDGGRAATADLVDYSRVNGNLSINLAEALIGQNGVITGVEGIRGNNAGPDSLHSAELVGPDGGAIWRIGNFGGPLADGVNDGEVSFGDQTISFLDFNLLTGGAGADTFNQISGVLGALNGGAGNDTFIIDLVGANAGTRVIGGSGSDTLLLRGGDAAGVLTYTAAANGGEFDYGHEGVHYKVGHQEVEILRDQSLAQTLQIRGSSLAETFGLGNGRFQVNGGEQIEYSSKRDIAVNTGINDIIDIMENLQVEGSLTLANGTVIANDPANSSITAQTLILDSVRDVGLASARLRTSVENLAVRNSAGDIYLQEQNGLNLTEFNANGVFDLLLLNGDLSSSAPLFAADVFRVVANNGDITLTGTNQLRDDVALTGNRVELHNASTLTLVDVQAQELILRTQRGIEGDGPIVVSGLTSIDAQGDVLFDFATNDFNRVRVTNAVNLTLVDQNAIELLDINASGAVVVRSTNSVTLSDQVTGATGVTVTSGVGSINQNGSITTSNGAVVVEAGNGQVNLGEDARILANGGSVNISAGTGDVNMGGSTRIVANGGDVTIVAADSVVVAEVVSSGLVTINAGAGGVSDGNGGATNVSAGGLQSSANTGFGSQDAIETQVGKIDIATNSGNVAVSNTGSVTVDGVSTGQGDISLVNQGDVDLGAGSISAQDGANGGSVDISVSQGSVTQSGSTTVPAVKGTGTVVISAPDGAIGAGGGIRVDAPAVEIIAAIKAGEIFVNPGADKIEYFSGSFKFDDQLLAIAPLEDINPAIFANVKSYFFNDISLLLPRDQRYEDDEEEE